MYRIAYTRRENPLLAGIPFGNRRELVTTDLVRNNRAIPDIDLDPSGGITELFVAGTLLDQTVGLYFVTFGPNTIRLLSKPPEELHVAA